MHRLNMSIRSAGLLAWVMAAFALTPSAFAQQQVLELRPNLQALPAFELSIVSTTETGKQLRFSATTWNSGEGPLELRAGETGSAGQNVYQRVQLDNGTSYDRLAGTFEWHPEHNHFHFGDYALYALQPVNAPGASQRTGAKTTFCVMDTDKISPKLPGAPRNAVYGGCDAAVQGMSVGWGDTYGSHLAGQSLDINDTPDGVYDLTIEADPKNRLIETNENDNISCVRINLSGFFASVLGPCGPVPGTVVLSSISPSTVNAGAVTTVTITGSGFTAGLSVSFEGGAGPRPTASNTVVVDANTIRTNVTVKNNKQSRGSVWDLRVGSAVLADALTIAP